MTTSLGEAVMPSAPCLVVVWSSRPRCACRLASTDVDCQAERIAVPDRPPKIKPRWLMIAQKTKFSPLEAVRLRGKSRRIRLRLMRCIRRASFFREKVPDNFGGTIAVFCDQVEIHPMRTRITRDTISAMRLSTRHKSAPYFGILSSDAHRIGKIKADWCLLIKSVEGLNHVARVCCCKRDDLLGAGSTGGTGRSSFGT